MANGNARHAIRTMALPPALRRTQRQDTNEDRRILGEIVKEFPYRSRIDIENEFYLAGGDCNRFDYLYDELVGC